MLSEGSKSKPLYWKVADRTLSPLNLKGHSNIFVLQIAFSSFKKKQFVVSITFIVKPKKSKIELKSTTPNERVLMFYFINLVRKGSFLYVFMIELESGLCSNTKYNLVPILQTSYLHRKL